MQIQKQSKKILGAILFTSIAFSGCGRFSPDQKSVRSSTSLQSPDEELFIDASNEAQDGVLSDDSSERILRRRFVRVKLALLRRASQQVGSTFTLNLFSGENLKIRFEEVQKISENNIIVVGRIVDDELSAVTLVLNDDVLIANIRRGDRDENYEVRYKGNGLHAIQVVEENRDEDCEEVEVPASEALADDESLLGSVQTDIPMAAPVIDILAAYTPKARTSVGGTSAIKALIQMGIADTNRALADSGSSLSVRLAGTIALKQNETGKWSSDLSALKSKTDSRWNEVHTERARLGADQVSVVGSYSGSGTAGIGYINASASSAFTITKASAFKQYTFSHELGHNLGLRHEDGYVNSAGRFRTIIAYGSYPRIRRYSNPDRLCNGYKTGDSRHNETRIINNSGGVRLSNLLAPR